MKLQNFKERRELHKTIEPLYITGPQRFLEITSMPRYDTPYVLSHCYLFH